MAPLAPHLSTVRRQVVVLVGVVTILSAFVKNVGALAILMPIVFQQARRAGTLASSRADAAGVRLAARRADDPDRHLAQRDRLAHARGAAGRAVHDVRLPARRRRASPLAGVAFLAFGYRLLPGGRKGSGLDRSGVQHRGLHDRGDAARGLAHGRQDRGRARGLERRRGHGHRDHPRAFPPLRAVLALDAVPRTTCSILQGEPAALERLDRARQAPAGDQGRRAASDCRPRGRRDGGGGRRRIAAGRPHGGAARPAGALSGQPGRRQPQRRAADAAPARGAVPRRRRDRPPGRPRRLARHAGRAAPACPWPRAACRSAAAATPTCRWRVLAAAMAARRAAAGAGGDRLLRRRGAAAAAARADPARGLRGGRVADPDPAGRARSR